MNADLSQVRMVIFGGVMRVECARVQCGWTQSYIGYHSLVSITDTAGAHACVPDQVCHCEELAEELDRLRERAATCCGANQ